jgi:hypothetical protein
MKYTKVQRKMLFNIVENTVFKNMDSNVVKRNKIEYRDEQYEITIRAPRDLFSTTLFIDLKEIQTGKEIHFNSYDYFFQPKDVSAMYKKVRSICLDTTKHMIENEIKLINEVLTNYKNK